MFKSLRTPSNILITLFFAYPFPSFADECIKDPAALERQAEHYYQDQNQVKAFETYLHALEMPIADKPESVISADEQTKFDKAYQLYLDPQGTTVQEDAHQILEANLPILDQHPDYYYLKYITGLAYANLGMYPKFFPMFFEAYTHHPKSYLVEKTKALLNIKLYELASKPQDKEQYRQKIEMHIRLAIGINPQDTNLYKMAIAFSSPDDRRAIVQNSLEALINKNIQVPRHEILFYIRNAVDVKLNSLAQQFLDKAKVWYPVSRAISSAQAYLDQQGQEG